MANIRRWMAEARRLQEDGDVRGAISLFRKALAAQEETTGFADLSLYNGLGDLYLRAGELDEAVKAFEKSVTQCEEQQLYANGIAVCKKILRNAPDHSDAYRKVGRLLALSGLEAEARANFDLYRGRMDEAGRSDDSLSALSEWVELTDEEGSCLSLADRLVEAGKPNDALIEVRALRDRLEAGNRDVDALNQRLDELAARDDVTLPTRAPGPATGRECRSELETPAHTRSASVVEPAAKVEPASEPAAAVQPPSPRLPVSSEAARPASASGSRRDPDHSDLVNQLNRVLNSGSDNGRFRQALPLIERLLALQPGQFELLHRKLAYAYAVGDARSAAEAYLAIGECLDRELPGSSAPSTSASSVRGQALPTVETVEQETASPAPVV